MTIAYDTKQFEAALQRIDFTVDEFKFIESKGAKVLVDGMKQRSGFDTGDMRNSIQPHIIEASLDKIEDDIGPEVNYGPYQEYGTGIYAEAGNGRKTPWVYKRKDGGFITTKGNRPHPFVRPTAIEDKDKVVQALDKEFKRYIITKWLK